MAYSDPAKQKAYRAAYYAANKDKWRAAGAASTKAWKAANRDKINARDKATYYRNRAALADPYVRRTLKLTKHVAPPELIEAKRLQLKIYRMTRET